MVGVEGAVVWVRARVPGIVAGGTPGVARVVGGAPLVARLVLALTTDLLTLGRPLTPPRPSDRRRFTPPT